MRRSSFSLFRLEVGTADQCASIVKLRQGLACALPRTAEEKDKKKEKKKRREKKKAGLVTNRQKRLPSFKVAFLEHSFSLSQRAALYFSPLVLSYTQHRACPAIQIAKMCLFEDTQSGSDVAMVSSWPLTQLCDLRSHVRHTFPSQERQN